jgi:hypothetical protein
MRRIFLSLMMTITAVLGTVVVSDVAGAAVTNATRYACTSGNSLNRNYVTYTETDANASGTVYFYDGAWC